MNTDQSFSQTDDLMLMQRDVSNIDGVPDRDRLIEAHAMHNGKPLPPVSGRVFPDAPAKKMGTVSWPSIGEVDTTTARAFAQSILAVCNAVDVGLAEKLGAVEGAKRTKSLRP